MASRPPDVPRERVPSPAALAAREVDVALRDGSSVHVRPVRPDDLPALRAFLESLSPNARRLRFFTGAPDLRAAARWAAEVNRHERDGLLALAGDGTIVGHAAWARIDAQSAEVAFETGEEMRGRGLATILLAHLAFGARAQGIATFVAEVLPENHRMLGVFRESGLPQRVAAGPGLLTVEMPTAFTDGARERFWQRERIAAVAAMDAVLRPGSIAVVGASPDPETMGGAVFANLLKGGYGGALHPVNRRGRPIGTHPCHTRIADVPGELDLAVLAIPAREVLGVARACAARGVRALAVLANGFAEAGEEGAERQRELLAICRAGGMRLVGPNCLGVMNTDPAVRLDATFAPTAPPAGGIALMSQSGGVGIAVLEHARRLGIGISAFASVGNKADLSGNDFLEWCEGDARTRAILLYLESFGNPRKFARIAQRVGRTKPIVAVKAGRSAAGARAASSHTGALLAGSDDAVEALFHQSGVLRVDSLGELFDLAALLERQPLPAGDRVAIVTNAGGPGVLAADACHAVGLALPPLPPQLGRELAAGTSGNVGAANPVDLSAEAVPADFGAAVEAIGRSGAVDAIIAVYVPRPLARPADVAAELRAASAALAGRVTLLTVFMTADGPPAALEDPSAALPLFSYPEDAARALARAVAHARWRAAPRGEAPRFDDARPDEAAAIIARALAADGEDGGGAREARAREAGARGRSGGGEAGARERSGGGWLDPMQVHDLLACHGLPLPRQRIVRSPTAAARAAAELGGPVALKAVAPELHRKSDVGGVALDLRGPTAVRRAALSMRERLAGAGFAVEAFVVQAMAPSGMEMLVGATADPQFGPVVAVGAGGRAVELLRDVAVRLTPVTDRDAHEMVRQLGTFPLLDGYRGAAPLDVGALEQVVQRVGALVAAHPEIVELDCNPVVVHEHGAVVIDASVRIAPPSPAAPTPRLRH